MLATVDVNLDFSIDLAFDSAGKSVARLDLYSGSLPLDAQATHLQRLQILGVPDSLLQDMRNKIVLVRRT